jgi:hypothetical protein
MLDRFVSKEKRLCQIEDRAFKMTVMRMLAGFLARLDWAFCQLTHVYDRERMGIPLAIIGHSSRGDPLFETCLP